ncbi:hypothetical protein RFI_39624, partial [Reticulomyxa filosa]
TEVTSFSLEHSCWILRSYQQEQIKHFICLICKQIANNPMDINCPHHANMDEMIIAGEHCLTLFLENNNNSCPIQPHNNCQYSRNNAVRKYLDDLTRMRNTWSDFKGKLKDLNNHLINECPLNLINCLFKPFGCNHTCFSHNLKNHLITNMKLYFNLVTQLLQSMKQEIQLKDNRIKQMERDYQQELLKYRVDIEMIKKDFNEKEKQILSNHTKIVKILEEKNSNLTQDYELLLQKLNHQHKEKEHKKQICVWDKRIQLFNRHLLDLCCVKFSQYHYHNHHCNVICSSSSDKTIRFCDVKTYKLLHVFNGHSMIRKYDRDVNVYFNLNKIKNLWWIVKTKIYKTNKSDQKTLSIFLQSNLNYFQRNMHKLNEINARANTMQKVI